MTSEAVSHTKQLKQIFSEYTEPLENAQKELLDLPLEKLGDTHVQYNLARIQYALELANNLQEKLLPLAQKLDKLEKTDNELFERFSSVIDKQKAKLDGVTKLLKKALGDCEAEIEDQKYRLAPDTKHYVVDYDDVKTATKNLKDALEKITNE